MKEKKDMPCMRCGSDEAGLIFNPDNNDKSKSWCVCMSCIKLAFETVFSSIKDK